MNNAAGDRPVPGPVPPAVHVPDGGTEKLTATRLFAATYQIILAMGIGTVVTMGIEALGLVFPVYVGGLLMGLVIRNLDDETGKFEVPMVEIDTLGRIALSIFIAMALMSLRLWELKDFALPLIAILAVQVVVTVLFVTFIGFRILGKDYDAAVMTAGVTGFGFGAMPVANMRALTKEVPTAPVVFLVVTGIGSIVGDLANSLLLTAFINLVA